MLDKNNFYLVGIKGVAMTALASCLQDLGKTVRGSDVAEDFPTRKVLDSLQVQVDVGFDGPLPEQTEVVIYSGAHGGSTNPQVQAAVKAGLPVYSHAEALAILANRQLPIAVCGVGGKSTISAMIAWIFEQTGRPQSYSVGVGAIGGLERTGRVRPEAKYFVVEADEYIADPTKKNERPRVFRFSFYRPQVIVCSSLRFDHPDVYRDFEDTEQVFLEFFGQLRSGGLLVYNGDDQPLGALIQKLAALRPDIQLVSYGESVGVDVSLADHGVVLSIPGNFNRLNGLAALAVTTRLGVPEAEALSALRQYRSVKRRFERIANDRGIEIWDDYAHHPGEVAAAIAAMREFRPGKRVVVAFQPHTYSRTKLLFDEFVTALSGAPELVLLDIFASARETNDPTIASSMLRDRILQLHPEKKVTLLHSPADLKKYWPTALQQGDVLLILGAGDIYHAVIND